MGMASQEDTLVLLPLTSNTSEGEASTDGGS